jgi:hypothetical protein
MSGGKNIGMSLQETRRIIEALANGIDPETGEVLPAQNAVNNPQVIRALFVASRELDRPRNGSNAAIRFPTRLESHGPPGKMRSCSQSSTPERPSLR